MAIKNRKTILDPIDVVTGECYLERIDFALPGPIPLEWNTQYSSRRNSDSPIGWHWTHSYHRYLVLKDKQIDYADGAGGVTPFPPISEIGQDVRSLDDRLLLRWKSPDLYELVTADNLTLTFRVTSAGRYARLERISNRNGHAVDLEYDRHGHVTTILDSAGRQFNLSLDGNGHIISISCSRPEDTGSSIRLVGYRYDRDGNLVEVIDASGHSHQYRYDGDHQLLQRTDRNGYSFHYRYADGRCVKTWGDDGLYSGEFTYERDKQRTIYLGFDGRRIEYRYDKNDQVVEEIDPYGRIETTQYDQSGNVAVTTDRCGRATVYKYDDHGNKVEGIGPTGSKTTSTFDELNQVLEEVSPSGERSAYEYDERGNVVREELPGGIVTTHEYDSDGHCVLTESTAHASEKNEYDRFHQLIVVRDATTEDVNVKYTYDILGNVTGLWDESGWIRYKHDRMSRLLEAKYPDGTSETNTYDPEGNVTSYTDREGRLWQYRYKAREQLVEEVAPDGGVTRYDYTKADELCRVVDPNGNSTEYEHDLCDEVVEVRRNGSIVESYENDPEGRVLLRKGADGELLLSQRHEVGEDPVAWAITKDSERIENTLTYDEHGNVLTAENSCARIVREYDARSRLVKESLNDEDVTHEFDDDDHLVQTSFNDQAIFQLSHEDSRIVVTDPKGKQHIWRLSGDKVDERVLDNDIREIWAYDVEERVTAHSISREGESDDTYVDRHLTYDRLGRLMSAEEDDFSRHFEYDLCGRLLRVERSEPNGGKRCDESFKYDPAGNLLPDSDALQAEIGSGNQLIRWGDRHFTYDSRGRLASETRGSETYRYHYDSDDQLVSVDLPDGRVVIYEYDALHRRVAKSIGSERVIFGWDGDRLSWERMADGVKRCYFYAGADEHSPVMFCDVPLSGGGTSAPAIYFVHYDHADRPILVTDEQGNRAWMAEVTAYGMTLVRSQSRITYNRRAPGQYYDPETGFHYNYHRYYDPQCGRFVQPDPIDLEGGLNVYAYGEGDPFTVCDVLGLKKK